MDTGAEELPMLGADVAGLVLNRPPFAPFAPADFICTHLYGENLNKQM